MKRHITLLLCLFTILSINAQNKPNCFRIYLTDKKNSPYSIEKPEEFLSERALTKRARFNISITEEDLPVNPSYIQQILNVDDTIEVLSQSKWTNTITIFCPRSKSLDSIMRLQFVSQSKPVAHYNLTQIIPNEKPVETEVVTKSTEKITNEQTDSSSHYGYAYGQIAIHHGDQLHKAGYQGKDMLIAVIDAGWRHFNTSPIQQRLYENGQIIGTRDLLPGKNNVYGETVDDERHGAVCTSVISTLYPDSIIGTAPEASFFFIRSENPWTEYPIEEDFWMTAAEIADSIGADVISSSLGYTTFDDSIYYPMTYVNQDGNSLISQVATKATAKGIVVCCSAGNNGADSWGYIARPADAKNILAVGAIDLDRNCAPFSSHGPSYDGRTKPDVTSIGFGTFGIYSDNKKDSIGSFNGTSLSCPVMAGLAACLWQSLPDKTVTELMQIIRENSDQYSTPDAFYGYGVPDFYAAYLAHTTGITSYSIPANQLTIYPNPCDGQCTLSSSTPLHNVQSNLFNMNGQLIQQINNMEIERETKFELTHCNSGIYILQISGYDDNGQRFNTYRKIIKK